MKKVFIHELKFQQQFLAFSKSLYRGNYNSINKFLSGVDWISVFNSTEDINIYLRFTNIVNESFKKDIPFYRGNKIPHLPRYLRNLQHLKNLYFTSHLLQEHVTKALLNKYQQLYE